MRRHFCRVTVPPKASSASSPCSAARYSCTTIQTTAQGTIAATPRFELARVALMRKRQRASTPPASHPSNSFPWNSRPTFEVQGRMPIPSAVGDSRRDVASVCPARPNAPCRGACRTPSTARTLPWRPRSAQRRDGTPFSATLRFVCSLLHFVRRTPGISCEAVPACCRGGAGIRRHLRLSAACGARVGAAESFVSFIPLFDSAPRLSKLLQFPC